MSARIMLRHCGGSCDAIPTLCVMKLVHLFLMLSFAYEHFVNTLVTHMKTIPLRKLYLSEVGAYQGTCGEFLECVFQCACRCFFKFITKVQIGTNKSVRYARESHTCSFLYSPVPRIANHGWACGLIISTNAFICPRFEGFIGQCEYSQGCRALGDPIFGTHGASTFLHSCSNIILDRVRRGAYRQPLIKRCGMDGKGFAMTPNLHRLLNWHVNNFSASQTPTGSRDSHILSKESRTTSEGRTLRAPYRATM